MNISASPTASAATQPPVAPSGCTGTTWAAVSPSPFRNKRQTVELAAVAGGVEGARIAKSMSFKLADDEPIIIVTAGDRKIDNAKYKAYFHVKAKMLTFDEACAFTGHAPGGVCSFALPENVKTYLDVSLKRFDTVFPAAGSANSAIEMTCDELEKYSSNFVAWVDVCKEKAPAPQA